MQPVTKPLLRGFVSSGQQRMDATFLVVERLLSAMSRIASMWETCELVLFSKITNQILTRS